MTAFEKENWEINITNAVAEVCHQYGEEVAAWVFKRYGANSFDDLSPCDYAEVFADLEQIIND